MKKLLIILLILICYINVTAQTTTAADNIVARKSLTLGNKRVDAIQIDSNLTQDSKLPTSKAVKDFVEGRLGSIASGSIVSGGPITTIPVVGTIIPTNLSPADWIDSAFYGAQPPIASLSGGTVLEFSTGSAVNRTLTWVAARNTATQPLFSVTVGGVSQTFTNPSAPGSTNGTQVVSVPINTNTTYSNVVIALNGMSSTATTTYSYMRKYYIGYVTTTTPTDADIIAATGGTVGGTFASTYITAGSLPTPPAARYIMFAYPASFGTSIQTINGLDVGFILTTRAFINASGNSTSYNIYVSPYPTNAGITYTIH